jgi:hypothetical protein
VTEREVAEGVMRCEWRIAQDWPLVPDSEAAMRILGAMDEQARLLGFYPVECVA